MTLLEAAKSRRPVRLRVGGEVVVGVVIIVGRECLVLRRGSLRGSKILASAIESIEAVR